MPILILWAVALSTGGSALQRYAHEPGERGASQVVWPDGPDLPRAAGTPTLLLFAHEQCPCTAATIGELHRLLAAVTRQPRVIVLMVSEIAAHDADAPNARRAAAVPGARLVADNGRIARRFRAMTSGQVLVYDAAGALRFSGGITPARGHEGNNVGRAAAIRALEAAHTDLVAAPVFGCALFSDARRP